LDFKGQIRVFCRMRPLNVSHETADSLQLRLDEAACSRRDQFTVEVNRALTSVDGNQRHEKKPFSFDAVFGPTAQQDEVFQEVQDLVQSAIDGYNVTVMAYGQTGAGKTYTMYGGQDAQRGVAPRAIELLFQQLEKMNKERFSYTVHAHLVELYKTDLLDLLAPGSGGRGRAGLVGSTSTGALGAGPPGSFAPSAQRLEVRRDARTGDSSVDNVEEREVKSAEELLDLLEEGLEHRHTSSTLMNEDSSRSHLFLTIAVAIYDREAKTTVSGKVRLCDLAGSERPKRSGASGDVMREAIEINKALTALGDVIEALTRSTSRGLVPYRNHKLTQLLSDSLGGSAKTLMFVNVSSGRADIEETLNSLTYASRARNICNDVKGPTASSTASRSTPARYSSPRRASSNHYLLPARSDDQTTDSRAREASRNGNV